MMVKRGPAKSGAEDKANCRCKSCESATKWRPLAMKKTGSVQNLKNGSFLKNVEL